MTQVKNSSADSVNQRNAVTLRNKFVGCMIGLAIGDAVGFPNEMVNRDQIVKRGELTDMVARRGYEAGMFTDDTQMSICVAEGLLAAGQFVTRDADSVFAYQQIADRFIKWSHSPENCRAPGSTCMGSLAELSGVIRATSPDDLADLDPRLTRPTKNGCGSVMRTAPVALFLHRDRGQIVRVSDGQGRITHRHLISYQSTVYTALIVDSLIGADPSADAPEIAQAVDDAMNLQIPDYDHGETDSLLNEAIDRAASYATDAFDAMPAAHDESAYKMLGQGFVSHEALAGAVYAALRYPNDFESAILLAANAGGDTDSLASVTGAFLGAKLGIGAIRYDWIQRLERVEELVALADALYEAWAGYNMHHT